MPQQAPPTISAVKRATRSATVAQVWEGVARAHVSMSAALERDLARVAGITNSGASRRLEQMTRAGLIERRSCPTDRRGVFAHLTNKGETAFKRAHAVFLSSLERNFGGSLKPEEAEVISAAL